MNDLLTRAEALKDCVQRRAVEAGTRPFLEALLDCCRELLNADHSAVALSLLDAALGLEQPADEDLLLRIGVIRCRALMLGGDPPASYKCATALAAQFPTPPRGLDLEWYELRISEAWGLWQSNRAEEAVGQLLVLRNELLRLPDSYPLALCNLQLSGAELTRGGNAQARRFALEAVVSSRRCGDRYIEGIALANLGRVERGLCRWAAAEDAASESARIFVDCANEKEESVALRTLAIVRWKRGRLNEALAMADNCIIEAKRMGRGLHEWYSSLLSGMVLLHGGRFGPARELFTSGVGWEVPRAESRPSLLTTEFLGDIHLEQGQAEQALKHYDDVWPKALALVPKGDIVAELRRRRAECYYLLGRHGEAYAEAVTGLEHCRELGDRYEEAATYRVLALAAAGAGKPAEAKRWFDQGFAYYDDIETPYEWGKLWMAYGDWLRGPSAGEYAETRGALEAYRAARDYFERMGAAAKLAEANARITEMAEAHAALAGDINPDRSQHASIEVTRTPRRPRGSAELDRRSAWAREHFGFITRNRMVLDLLADVSKLATANSPMLILGESGTGKELVAHGVHRLSARNGNFVPINCAALPREVIESELFGHVAGAFTGATRDKAGLLEVCDHGTVFLDEIAEMTLELQSRLLRFLETGEIRRVGANKNLGVDTLVVAATNRERASLEKGEGFRPDLYYRLAHAVVVLPPLRRRGEDIDLLISHFMSEACALHQKQVTLSDGARNRLIAYPWPGNIRQLRAVMRRLVILSPVDHRVTPEEVHLDDADIAGTLTEELEQAERRRMVEALSHSAGSRSDAARSLGMARTTFVTKMKRYGIR